MKKIKTAILISGRGSNMLSLIKACQNPDFPAEISLVISNKKDAKGLEIAQNHGIKTAFIDHKNFADRQSFDDALNHEIAQNNCEIVCLAGFMRLLTSNFTKKWQGRALNIHPSLLPEFKGADAVGDAIKAKAAISGCTVHFVEEEMDSGQIIAKAKVEIAPNDTKETLAAKILQHEHRIYPIALEKLACDLIKKAL